MMDITAHYKRSDFLDFLSNSFLPDDFETASDTVTPDKANSFITTAVKLGSCPSLDLSVYEFLHTSGHDPRVRLSREAFSLLEHYDNTASNAIAVFYNKDTGNWRLSLITSEYSIGSKKGQIKRGFSNPRRFSWLLGKNCKKHTPESMLFTKGRVSSIEDLSSRFAIDTVTKEFYKELFNWYDTWAINVVKFPVGEGAAAGLPKNPDVEANRQHLIRLITRLIFVWFLKQKDNLIPEWIFKESDITDVLKTFEPHSNKKGNYYNGIIQNLFFATLNKEITQRDFTNDANSREHYGIKTFYRDHADAKHPAGSLLFKISQAEFIKKFETVPFLNGGLFECLDRREGSEKQKYVDGFSREKSRAAFVPNCLFFGDDEREGIIDLFNRYNFTVEENTPQDIDIALDPELLGKVFENLLGTYNEETKSTARNESGSFYTPREIVEYMVDTSLKEYFKGKLENNDKGSEEKLNRLFSYHETTHDFSPDEVVTLMSAIHHCKILDPACGSGAFPMGILNKLTFIMEKLDPDNKQWQEIQIQKAKKDTEEAYRSGNKEQRDERIKEISDVFELSTGKHANYARKLFLIENCIFGIDIQPIAIQISKLRFFISLIVDQKTGGAKENNYNVLPLPNLETKFVAVNTLIGVDRLKKGEQGLLADSDIEEKQKVLLDIRHKHFSARKADEKNELRKRDEALSEDLAELLEKDGFYNSADAGKMAKWNPYDQTKMVDFFDAYWMFGIKDGFDLVIGNPPYVEHKKLKDLVSLIKHDYVVYSGTADLSVYFIEKGFKLCKSNGFLTYIITNKFFNTEYGHCVREYLLQYQFRLFINFEQVAVFQNALVSTTIFGISVTPKNKDEFIHQQYYQLKHDEFISKFVSDCLSGFGTYKQSSLSTAEWSFSDSAELVIKEKIEFQNKRIEEIESISVFRGVTTGYNPAFIIDTSTKKGLISADNKNKEIIKPMLQGRNIRKWIYEESDNYLLQTGYDTNIQKNYPSIYEHLKKYLNELKDRSDQGLKWWNLRACKYYPEFEKEKIIWGLTADKWAFAYDDKQHYLPSNGYILTSTKIPVKYLLALLNSNLLKYYFGFIGVMTAGGAYTLKHGTIQALPVKIAKDNKLFIGLVDKILAAKAVNSKADTSALERQIDNLVYRLYNLTYEEVKVIEPEFSLTKVEYERIELEGGK